MSFSLSAAQRACLTAAAGGDLYFTRNGWRGRGYRARSFGITTTAKLVKLRLVLPRAINGGQALALVATADGEALLSQLARMEA